ncbi:MAG: nuclear transport factor 2 family protein [Rhodoglobus sp.]
MTDILKNWIAAYKAAWTSNDPADIRALFTDDAIYKHNPFDAEPWRGIDEILDGWLKSPDDPSEWTFEGVPLFYADGVGAIEGETRYSDGSVYANLWILRFGDDGRVNDFTEWWMQPKKD